ncbi:MAG TPA: ABC transporter permease [Candidatus Sulfotelmatobacter sp.]|nr:ABC transporter permease [Candidatus Sulfotelmatobacter sp.]
MARFALPLALLAGWWLATARGWVKSYQFASPHDVLAELGNLAATGALWHDLAASVARVAAGFAIALAAAIVLGAVVGGSRTFERALDPTLQAIRAVPSLAWVPLILLWLGIGESAKITLVAIGAFFPIYVALVAGIRGVDRKLVEVGTSLGLSRAALIARVLVPATLPQLLVGARIGLTQAWLFLVAAELLAATNGIGFLLTDGQQTTRTDEILVAILLFAACGKLSESGMRWLERRLVGWTDTVPA